jgi:dTDP-4-amino-4,6-dideoxygalactose transaminase
MKAMKVPFLNLVAQHAPLKKDLQKAFAGVLAHGQFIRGPEVADFEERFAALHGVAHAVSVNSGTDALILALRALGVTCGDEVITAPNSFVASTSAIRLVGATAVFADVGPDYNIDPVLVERAITPRTKAILPIHLTGRAADMTAILAIAKRHKLLVVEDCAQAVLAEHRGRRVGSFGEAGCFSLHPLKTLNACGDGGVIATGDVKLRDHLRIMRNIGLEFRDDCLEWNGNSRLDTLQAALLLVKLKHLDAWTNKRRANAAFYQKALSGIRGVVVPSDRADERAVYHTFIVLADDRENLRKHLSERGVETAIHYPKPIHFQTVCKDMKLGPGSFPVTENQAGRILSLPVYPELTRPQMNHVVKSIKDFYHP